MSSLKDKAISGVKWNIVATSFTTFLRFFQAIVLARLLFPTDFGLMGMVGVVVGFMSVYLDLGVSNAIVCQQEPTKEQLSSLYWLNIFSGIGMLFVLWLCIPLLVRFYNEPRLSTLLFWVAWTFPISSIGRQYQALLLKELRFFQLAKIEFFSLVGGFVCTVGMALYGLGVYSLVWGTLSTVSLRTIFTLYFSDKYWHPILRFRLTDLTKYRKFSLYQLGEQSINFFTANIDYLIIGKYLGPEKLGYYSLAYQLVTFPLQRINPILMNVAFPFFAKKQNDHVSLTRNFLDAVKLLAIITCPLLFGLAASAPCFVPAIYGNKWMEMIPLLQALFLLGVFKAISNPNGAIVLAKGRADVGFYWNLLVAGLNSIVFLLFVEQGIIAIAVTYSILTIVYFATGTVILAHIIQLKWSMYFKTFVWSVISGSLMGVVVLTNYYLFRNSLGASFLLIYLVIIGLITYSILMFLLEREFLLKMWKTIIH